MRHPDDGLIEEYLDGELPAGARAELEAHAAACEACRDRLEAARATRAEADDLVSLLGEPDPRPGTALPSSLTRDSRRRFPWRTLAWAATVVIAAGIGYAGGAVRRVTDPAGVAPAPPARTGTAAPPERQSPAAADRVPPRSPALQPSSPPATETPAEPQSDRPVEQAAKAPESALAAQPSNPQAPAMVSEFRRLDEAATYVDGVPAVPGNRGTGFVSPAAPTGKQRVDGALAQPLTNDAPVRQAELEWPRRELAESPNLDDAVRALGGSIRLVDGLEVQRVEVAWLPMPGGDSAAVVELTYADAAGRPIVLRQSRMPAGVGQLAGADAVPAKAAAPAAARDRARAAELPSRQAAEPSRDGELTWVDESGFRLVLRADADADSLARLRARVR